MTTPSASTPPNVDTLVEHLFRTEYGRLVAILTSTFGFDHIELAEDIAQETMFAAFTQWSYGTVPDNPAAWLMRVARNKALNQVKHEQRRSRIHGRFRAEAVEAAMPTDIGALDHQIEDALLRMMFACSQAPVADTDKIAIILKTLCGFGAREVARALVISEDAANKRLYRARGVLRDTQHEFVEPKGTDLDRALAVVATSLYLLYNEGYNATHGDVVIRRDLCYEAMRLCKLLTGRFPDRTDVRALMALMCFHTARFDSRIDSDGVILPFDEQERNLSDRRLIDTGITYLSRASRGADLSAYHLEASIVAQHCTAATADDTDWEFIRRLYERLVVLKPSPVVELNLAIALSRVGEVGAAIHRVAALREERRMATYSPLLTTLGELHRMDGRITQAIECFRQAKAHARSPRERRFLDMKIETVAPDVASPTD